MEFITTQMAKYPELSDSYAELGRLYEQKLWHQLTEKLCEFVVDPSNRKQSNLVDLYEKFVTTFEARLNQLKFVQVIAVVAQQFLQNSPATVKEYNAAVEFLDKITAKRGRLGEEAYVVAQMAVAELHIQVAATHEGKREASLAKAKDLFEEAKPIIQSLEGSGAETVVNSSYYRVSTEYYKVKGLADEFYKAALQFLAYTPLETLDAKVQSSLAIDMSIAALIGENVFNFGEVLAQPILGVLDNTEFSWIHSMLKIYSAGDIDRFNELYVANKSAFDSQSALASNMDLLKQKLALLSLMALVFTRPPEDRNIEFTTIAEASKLDVDQVEWLLMRGMSKGLIKGRIDQIDQTVSITWLKPRVLDVDQMGMLSEKLTAWTRSVDDTLLFIENETPELFQ